MNGVMTVFSPRLLLATCALLLSAPAYADSFTDALVSTYKNNPTIKAERQRQEATDEEAAQAVSGFRPNITAGYSTGRQRTSFNGADWEYSDSDDQNLRVEQPLFRGGGTWSSWQAAKERAKAGQFQLKGVEQQVLLDGITAYMDVVRSTSILGLSQNNEGVLGQQLTASRDRFEVGEVTRTDVAQSEARLSNARTQVIAAEGQLISAIARFERVIGYKPEGMLDQPASLPEIPASLDEAQQVARSANADLLSAIHAAKGADYDIDTNISVLLPQVSLVGTMARQDGAGVLGNTQFDQDALGLEVSIPLYQSGAEHSRVREAKNLARQREYQSRDAQLVVDQQVTSAWEALETAVATITTRDEQIQAAQVALDGVRQEQEYGARTVLDVLDAEQELFVARTNLVQAQRDRVVAAYNLVLTLGRLTPQFLNLPVQQYDPQEHYDDVEWQFIGF